jgi:hypothetical protein
MTNLRLSRSQTEKAIAAFINAQKATGPNPDVNVNVRMGTIDMANGGAFLLKDLAEIPLPSIAVAAPRSERHPMGYSVVTLHIIVLGSIDGSDDTKDRLDEHTNLVGWAARIFSEENREFVKTQVNPGGAGRVVPEFTMFGMLLVDEVSTETDRAFIDDFTYTVHCEPVDDTTL